MSGAIDTANTLGSAIGNWGKIIAVILGIVGSGFLTYYQIQENSSGVLGNKVLIEQERVYTQKEFKLWGERSDKRYKRAMDMGLEMQRHIERQYKMIIDLERKVSYIEGQRSIKK